MALTVFVTAAVVISLTSFLFSCNKWFTLDEVLLATRAHMINVAGLQGPAQVLGDEAFTHPPLYESLLALVFKLFGENDLAGRSFGILCYFFVGALLCYLFLGLVRDERPFLKKTGLLVCLALYGLSPLMIQHSMLIDAETTCTYSFTMAFVCLFVLGDAWTGRRYILSRLGLGVIFALAFFGKEFTPFLLVSAAAVYRIANRQWKRLGAEMLLTVLFGAALIALGFILYRFFSGMEMVTFLTKQYGFRAGRIAKIAFLKTVWKHLFQIARWPVFWMSAPFFAFLLACFFSRIARYCRCLRLEMVDYCLLTGAVIWIPYLFFKPSIDMMKYQYPAYPFFIAGMAFYFTRSLGRYRWLPERYFQRDARLAAVILASMVLLGIYYYHLGDYLFYMFRRPESDPWRDFFWKYYTPMLIAGAALAIFAFYNRHRALPVFLGACLLFTAPVNAALDMRQWQPSYTTVESYLNYGETGFQETAEYLAGRIHPGESISSRDDLLYYLRYRYHIKVREHIALSAFFRIQDPVQIKEWFTSKHLKFIVIDNVTLSYVNVKNMVGVRFLTNYHAVAEFGNFKIFVRNGAR